MRIVVLDGYTTNPGDLSWEPLQALGRVKIYDRTPKNELRGRISGADIVVTNKTPITREDLAACPSIRMISVLATGYNIVDIAAARELGIPVCNVPAYATQAVAQLTIALLLESCHRIALHSAGVHAGKWTQVPDYSYSEAPLVELSGMTLGIVGLGAIGKAVARIALALDMKVCAYELHPAPMPGVEFLELDPLLEKSDVVSLHCPQTPENYHMVDAPFLARMKRGARLINTSRGGLVVESDIRAALESGQLGFYLCDVLETEPMRADNPLLGAPNAILTPHIAWAPAASRKRLLDATVRNIIAFMNEKPVNVVN